MKRDRIGYLEADRERSPVYRFTEIVKMQAKLTLCLTKISKRHRGCQRELLIGLGGRYWNLGALRELLLREARQPCFDSNWERDPFRKAESREPSHLDHTRLTF